MLLEYETLRIRDAVSKDAEQLAAWWNDGAVMAHAGFPKGLGVSPERVREQLKGADGKHRLFIEIDDRPAGEMCWYPAGERTAEIGIKICDPAMQEKGHGRKLLSMLITYLFHVEGFEKLVLDTDLKNLRAQHVYELLGFRKLRVNVDSWTDQLGRPQSSVDYELTPADFDSFLPSDRMMCMVFPIGSLKQYKYVVILSEYRGDILLSRRRDRSTWETQGGHIEPGETPEEAARRELFEESGAQEFTIAPLCDYRAGFPGTDDWSNGVVFRSEISALAPLPESEMAETRRFDELPENLTYPDITPVLFRYLAARRRSHITG